MYSDAGSPVFLLCLSVLQTGFLVIRTRRAGRSPFKTKFVIRLKAACLSSKPHSDTFVFLWAGGASSPFLHQHPAVYSLPAKVVTDLCAEIFSFCAQFLSVVGDIVSALVPVRGGG